MRALRVAVALALAAPTTRAHEASREDNWRRLFNVPQQQHNDARWLAQSENSGNGHHHKGFNLLYLIPILIGALLVLALIAWFLVRTCRNRKKKLKRSESALLPIIDPNALLLSPASREFYLQDETETNRQLQRGDEREEVDLSDFGSTLRTSESLMTSLRFDSTTGGGGGVIESFQNSGRGDPPAFVAPSTSSGLLDSFHNSKYKNQSQSITDAQATQLYRMLHADPNVSSHRLAYQKIAFERMLSTRSSPSGSASKTWLCQYEGEEIAVKVLQHHHSSSSSKASARKMKSASRKNNDADCRYEDLRRLVDEIQLTASLEHPNIVRFLAVAWDSMAIESLCLITEYLPEGNLSDHLQATQYPTWTHRKLRFAIGVANALEYLHSRKVPLEQSPSSSSANSSSSIGPTAILHRDVRAKNVGVSHTFEPKLVNIGAKHDYLSISPELVAAGDGNAFWTAPEVLSGRRYSEKSDIYAFGVLLSEIDTNGNLPYANTKSEDRQQLRPFQVLNLVASGKLRPTFSPNCPVRVREIAAMCLCNDPFQRVNAATLTQLLESYDKTLAQ